MAHQGKAKHRKKKPLGKPPLVLRTVDLWANNVYCTQSNWDSHIIVEHPELVGREADVKKTIEDPDRVSPSTLTGLAYGHEKQIATQTIRAIVYYDDPANIVSGRTHGKVGTAYVVDTVNYTSRIGKPIYEKPSPQPTVVHPNNGEGEKGGGS